MREEADPASERRKSRALCLDERSEQTTPEEDNGPACRGPLDRVEAPRLSEHLFVLASET